MPKGERKSKGSARKRLERHQEPEEFDDEAVSVADSAGTPSVNSFDSSDDDVDPGQEEIDDTRYRIDDFLEQTEHKSSKTREKGVEGLCVQFCKTYLPDVMECRKETLLSAVLRMLKRGSDAEKMGSCRLAGVLLIQLGASDDAEHYLEEVRPFLLSTLLDHTKSPSLRAECARVLALGSFILGAGVASSEEVVAKFEALLHSASGSSSDSLVSAVMSSWSLLLTCSDPHAIIPRASSLVGLFMKFLGSKEPATRVSAGEAIAVIYELAWQSDSDFYSADHDDIVERCKELATDHSHHRSKGERKDGRAKFRPIRLYLEEGIAPEEKMVLCKQQCLKLTDWSDIKTCEFMRDVLGSGLKEHLKENEFLREVFSLGSSLGMDCERSALSKEEKKRLHATMKTRRQMDRSGARDKRSAVF